MLKRTDHIDLPGDTRAALATLPAAIVVAELLTAGIDRAILVVEDEARAEAIACLAEGSPCDDRRSSRCERCTARRLRAAQRRQCRAPGRGAAPSARRDRDSLD
ncbi:hypothetical protein QP185_14550 [Sphingomonas aerolata]|uniref:hypothetical protein n=1 Tax=Sphingomonas aerolata TaxID=185951 RepID=UPI002FE1B864